MKKKKEITNENLASMIEDLASSTKKGFDGVDKRFGEIDKRFDNVERDINEIKGSIEDINLRFGSVAWAIDLKDLKGRVQKLEQKNNK